MSSAPAAPAPPVKLPPATPLRPDAGAPNCALVPQPGEPVGTVALSDRVNPANAPRPSNESERLLFRQLYETLVRVDCTGQVAPGLAASWRLDADGRTWIVTLRANARFSDGTPVTAADVLASWTRDHIGGELQPPVRRLIETITVAGEGVLAIALERTRTDAPLALAHPDLAIAKRVADSPWPVGTRSGRVATEDAGPIAGAATVVTVVRNGLADLRFVVADGDLRDLLDEGVDLLLTRDPAALEYAGTLPQFQSVPLGWQRLHVLLTPGRSRSSPFLSAEATQVLADDAVRGEAQGARGPFWWQMLPECEVAPVPARDQSPAPRIVYDASDGAARDLAERLVGLVRASGPAATAFLDALLPDRPQRTYQRAVGLSGDALARARRQGADAGYVVSLDRRPVDPCRDLRALSESARWVDPDTIVPLVETRLRAILRRGKSGVTAEWDGGLVVADAADPR